MFLFRSPVSLQTSIVLNLKQIYAHPWLNYKKVYVIKKFVFKNEEITTVLLLTNSHAETRLFSELDLYNA